MNAHRQMVQDSLRDLYRDTYIGRPFSMVTTFPAAAFPHTSQIKSFASSLQVCTSLIGTKILSPHPEHVMY